MRFPILVAVSLLAACNGGHRAPAVKKLEVTAPAPATLELPRQAAAAPDAGTASVTVTEPESDPDDLKEVVPADALPATFDERMRLGARRGAQGRIDEALAAYAGAAALRPESERPHVEMARLLIQDKDLKAAAEQADSAVELAPSSSSAWNTKGRILFLEKRIPSAIEAFTRATEVGPENLFAWNNLGLVFLHSGQLDKAIEALETATSREGAEPYMWTNLGIAYERAHRLVEARASYKQASLLGSTEARARMLRLDEQTAMVNDEDAPDVLH